MLPAPTEILDALKTVLGAIREAQQVLDLEEDLDADDRATVWTGLDDAEDDILYVIHSLGRVDSGSS
jgi:hypothetical protein